MIRGGEGGREEGRGDRTRGLIYKHKKLVKDASAGVQFVSESQPRALDSRKVLPVD